MASESAQYLSELHKQIDTYFSFNEVKTLCFDLGVDYENIPGNIRSAFIRNLIVSLAKQNRLQELVNKVRDERPFVDWQNVPSNFELPTSVAEEDIRQLVTYNVYGGDVVHGDKVAGDKIAGDRISVGNISGGEGIAIGSGASATHTSQTTVPPVNATVSQAATRLTKYLDLVPAGDKTAAEEVAAAVTLIQAEAAQPVTPLHLKLLCLGLQQLADRLTDSIPRRVVDDFITAVRPINFSK